MKRLVAMMMCAVSLGAVAQITYPYNPDGNADSLIGVSDLQDILSTYGQQFEVDSIYIDSLELYVFLQSLLQRIETIESLQFANEAIPSYMLNLGDGSSGDFILEPGQLNVPLEPGNYGTIYIPEGASATIMPHATSVIRANQSFILEGFLNGSGGNAAGGSGPYSNNVHLMSSGGSKGGGWNGGYSGISNCSMTSESGGINGFASESFFDVDQLGGVTSGSLATVEGALQVFPFLHGGDGGSSYYWSGGNIYCGSPGGQGGGGLYVFSPEIVVSGYLWLNGGDGQACVQAQQGRNATGGGGGGKAVLCGQNISFSGEFRADGGSGGGCSNIPPYAMLPAGDGQNGSLYSLEW